MSHPYIIKFKDVLLHDASIWIVMEYATGGSLFDRVRTGASEDAARWGLLLTPCESHARMDLNGMGCCRVCMSVCVGKEASRWQAACTCQPRTMFGDEDVAR